MPDRKADAQAAARALREAAETLAREVGHEVTNARAVAFLYRRAEVYERLIEPDDEPGSYP